MKKESAAMFRYCNDLSVKEGWTEMSGFVEASRKWLEVELSQQLLRGKELDEGKNGEKNGEEDGKTFPVSRAVEELKEQ
jgi:hypothetical protein